MTGSLDSEYEPVIIDDERLKNCRAMSRIDAAPGTVAAVIKVDDVTTGKGIQQREYKAVHVRLSHKDRPDAEQVVFYEPNSELHLQTLADLSEYFVKIAAGQPLTDIWKAFVHADHAAGLVGDPDPTLRFGEGPALTAPAVAVSLNVMEQLQRLAVIDARREHFDSALGTLVLVPTKKILEMMETAFGAGRAVREAEVPHQNQQIAARASGKKNRAKAVEWRLLFIPWAQAWIDAWGGPLPPTIDELADYVCDPANWKKRGFAGGPRATKVELAELGDHPPPSRKWVHENHSKLKREGLSGTREPPPKPGL